MLYRTIPVPKRIQDLKDELFRTKTEYCFERAHLVTESYKATSGLHIALRRAHSLYAVFDKIPIFIRPGELIVGQRTSVLGGRAVYPEYNLAGLNCENTPAEIWDYWHGKTIGDVAKKAHPECLRLAESEMAAGFVTGTNSGFGHVIADYEKVLRRGFRAIAEEAQTYHDTAPVDDNEGRSFLQAVIIVCQGIIRWAERYAFLAEEKAKSTDDKQRRAELTRIARTCRRVPAEPARSFDEALQSFWFTHLALHIEQYGWSISAGRFDQYMYQFYQDDVNEHKLTQNKAWEFLLNLWVKFMENVGINVKETIFQNLTLGGQDAIGQDQTNELSKLCLDATVALRFNQPALSVRWHPGINQGFWTHVNCAISQGLGLPAIFNDNVIIPALESHGVAQDDAVGYGLVGCVEASIPGKQQGVTAGGHINLAKALELALTNGYSLVSGKQIGERTGDVREFKNFDDVWNAYVSQVHYLAGINILASHIAGEVQKQNGHCPLMSSLLDDCLARRRDLVYGGTRYNLPGIAIYGPSNAYDGLMAIKKWVYEEEFITLPAFVQALKEDFQGYEGLRQMISQRTSRFGNGIDEIDAFANRVNAVHADYCWEHLDSRNGRYTCGVWPVNGHVSAGQWTGATPDGRRKGEPLVDGVGACQGADRNGPTALLASVARLNNIDHWPAGNTCNVKFAQRNMQTIEEVDRMRELVTTFMRLGGQELQVNVVDGQTLYDAQENPERYTDLIVRVAGYSAYFTQLSREIQDEILSRTEQVV